MLSLMFQGLQVIWVGLSIGIVLFLPGAAWMAWFQRPEKGIAVHLATSAGISVALTALVALATFLFHFQLFAWDIVAIYGGLAAAAGSGWLRRRSEPRTHRVSWRAWELVLVVGVGLLLLAWRLYQARTLVLPAWVDSVHHALITRVIYEHGSLPGDLTPYLAVPFYYYFGFHSLTAVFMAVSRLPVDQAILILGQALSAGISLSIYRLSHAIWHDPKRALVAALLAGFFSHMPAYYLTWGRYTLLAGLLLLPLAMAEAVEIVQETPGESPNRIGQGLLMALLTAGVLLSHYLAALLLAAFLIVLGVYLVYRDLNLKKISWSQWTLLLGGALTGFGVCLPWLLRVWRYSPLALAIDVILPKEIGGPGYAPSYAGYLWYLAGPTRNYWFLLIGGLGLVWGLVAMKSRLLAIWSALVALGCLPLGYQLSPFRQDHLVILVFLPAAIFAGHVIISAGDGIKRALSYLALRFAPRKAATPVAETAELIDGLVPLESDGSFESPIERRRPPRWAGLAATGLVVGTVLGLCLWGIKDTQDILNPTTILATPGDMRALIWIEANLPQDAHFLINVTPWQGGVYRGVDGGWWIEPLSGRWEILPPVVYAWGDKPYIDKINGWAARVSALKGCDADFWALVREARLTYAYLRSGSGSLQPDNLQGCQRISPVYQQDGVTIFSIKPGQ